MSLKPRMSFSSEDLVIPESRHSPSMFRKCGIYFLFNFGELVYIGQSVDVISRINQHASIGRIAFDKFTYVECDKAFLDEAETAFTAFHKPRLNVSDKGTPTFRPMFSTSRRVDIDGEPSSLRFGTCKAGNDNTPAPSLGAPDTGATHPVRPTPAALATFERIKSTHEAMGTSLVFSTPICPEGDRLLSTHDVWYFHGPETDRSKTPPPKYRMIDAAGRLSRMYWLESEMLAILGEEAA